MVTGNNKPQPEESFPVKPQTAEEFEKAFHNFLASDTFDIELEPGANERIWGSVAEAMPPLTKDEVEEHVRKFEEFQKSRPETKPDPEFGERIRKAVKAKLSKLRKHQ